MRWMKARQGNRVNHPVNEVTSSLGGALWITAGSGCAGEQCFWEWNGTWEDLGVTPGEAVASVKANYQYRWQGKKKGVVGGSFDPISLAEFADNEVVTGPFELLDDSQTFIGTFSGSRYCIARSAPSNLWNGYPSGDPPDYPVTETPAAWAVAEGDDIVVPDDLQASTSIIRLRLRSVMPATLSARKHWLRLKQDRVVVTVEAALPKVVDLTLGSRNSELSLQSRRHSLTFGPRSTSLSLEPRKTMLHVTSRNANLTLPARG
jgi:hypothetical protein